MNSNSSSVADISTQNGSSPTSPAYLTTTLTTALVVFTTTPTAVPKCPVSNYSGVPDWYVRDLAMPFDEIFCATPIWKGVPSADYVNRLTGAIVDYRVVCWNHPRLVQLRFTANHYVAFYGIVPHNDLRNLASTMYTDRRQTQFNFLVLYTAPIALCSLGFGALVIKRSLQGDSHIFLYHLALIGVDMTLYTVTALERTELLQLVLLPFCFTSPFTSAYNLLNYAHLFSDTLIASLYFFGNAIQAALAADRFLAIFMPAWYHYHASNRLTVSVVTILFLTNAAYTLFDFLTDYVHGPALQGIINPGQAPRIMAGIAVPRMSVRVGLFLFVYACQLFCCVAVLLKIRQLKRKPAPGRGEAKSKQMNLFPCYLLIGTCGLNFFGCGVEIAYALLYNVLPITLATIPHITNVSGASPIIVPLLNGCGIYVHFFVSKQYRSTVAQMLEPILKQLRPLIAIFYHPAPKAAASAALAVVEESSISGTVSSGMSSGSYATTSRGQSGAVMDVVDVE